MIKGDYNSFLDKLYSGEELLFQFDGKKFFVQGWTKDNVKHLECWPYDEPDDPIIWEQDGSSMVQNAKDFLEAPLWNGKTFIEVEGSIEWLDE